MNVSCTNVAGVDNVFAANSTDDSAKVDQHTGPRNATSMYRLYLEHLLSYGTEQSVIGQWACRLIFNG